jgi:integrase/recombinase XerD
VTLTRLWKALHSRVNSSPELTRLRVGDILVGRASAIQLHGKGRKERAEPLWNSTAVQLRGWTNRIDRDPDAPVFPNRAGKPLSRSGVAHRLRVASRRRPNSARRSRGDASSAVRRKHHRHRQYVEADLAMKEAALSRIEPPTSLPVRYQVPDDRVLAFLQAL